MQQSSNDTTTNSSSTNDTEAYEACFTYLDELIDIGEINTDPTGLLLDYVYLFCEDYTEMQIACKIIHSNSILIHYLS